MILFGGWFIWAVAWVALAIGASKFSGYGNEFSAILTVLAAGVIVSIVVRRLTAAARITAQEQAFAKSEQSADWDETVPMEPIPHMALRIMLGYLVQNALLLCLPAVGAGYVLHRNWTESPVMAYGVAFAAVSGIAAIGSGLAAAWIEHDLRRQHQKWRDRKHRDKGV